MTDPKALAERCTECGSNLRWWSPSTLFNENDAGVCQSQYHRIRYSDLPNVPKWALAERKAREAHQAIDAWANERNRYVHPELAEFISQRIDAALRVTEKVARLDAFNEFRQRMDACEKNGGFVGKSIWDWIAIERDRLAAAVQEMEKEDSNG